MFTGTRTVYQERRWPHVTPEKTHWPFGPSEGAGDDREHDREQEREREQARLQAEVDRKAQTRHDRFLVGGRAHVKKRGVN
jgi:hypothetical protein